MKDIIIRIVPLLAWLTITVLVIFLRVFGNESIIFPIYLFSTLIGTVIFTAIPGFLTQKYIKENFGTWDEFSEVLKQEYNFDYVPPKSARNRIGWFAFRKIDFGNERLKSLKSMVKTGIYLLILIFALAVPLAIIFLVFGS